MPLLEVERLSKRFGGVRAVHDVSFILDEGELLGIMGPNGSGKTSLFNLIAGALRPDAGRIRLQGRDIAGLSPHRVCASGVARTFQLVRPFAGLSALENVLVGRLYGRARAADPVADAHALGERARRARECRRAAHADRSKAGAGARAGELPSLCADASCRPQSVRDRERETSSALVADGCP